MNGGIVRWGDDELEVVAGRHFVAVRGADGRVIVRLRVGELDALQQALEAALAGADEPVALDLTPGRRFHLRLDGDRIRFAAASAAFALSRGLSVDLLLWLKGRSLTGVTARLADPFASIAIERLPGGSLEIQGRHLRDSDLPDTLFTLAPGDAAAVAALFSGAVATVAADRGEIGGSGWSCRISRHGVGLHVVFTSGGESIGCLTSRASVALAVSSFGHCGGESREVA